MTIAVDWNVIYFYFCLLVVAWYGVATLDVLQHVSLTAVLLLYSSFLVVPERHLDASHRIHMHLCSSSLHSVLSGSLHTIKFIRFAAI